jgi:hypothetical protein
MLKISDYSIDFLYLVDFRRYRERFVALGAWISVVTAGMRPRIANAAYSGSPGITNACSSRQADISSRTTKAAALNCI